ncbi:MAG: ABC transporter permease [Chloroflexota bacterium]|nr:ABC transporter permease [Chloroflexota bacterium]
MLAYVFARFLQAIPVLVLASIAVFLMLRLVPGDPAELLAGQDATDEEVVRIRQQLGLTDSLPEQYFGWLADVFQGDLGVSFARGLPVSRMLRTAIPPTVELAVAAYLVAVVVGIPLGILGGIRPRSGWDWTLSGFTLVAIGIPGFLLGIIMLWVFSVRLDWFPVFGAVSIVDDPIESLRHLALPAVATGVGVAAVLARYTRTTIAEVMGNDYVRTARAKGLAESRVVVRHALRNSMIPVVTVMALQVGGLLVGAVIVEQVFTRPGLGRLVVNAIQARDYLVVQSTLIILVTVFIGANLAADIAYGFLDPRVRGR